MNTQQAPETKSMSPSEAILQLLMFGIVIFCFFYFQDNLKDFLHDILNHKHFTEQKSLQTQYSQSIEKTDKQLSYIKNLESVKNHVINGNTHMEKQEYEEALLNFQKADNLRTNDSFILFNIGVALMQLSYKEGNVHNFTRACYYQNLARLYMKRVKALTIDPLNKQFTLKEGIVPRVEAKARKYYAEHCL
jgi:tetratricopeptide (TPR) repeat protein